MEIHIFPHQVFKLLERQIGENLNRASLISWTLCWWLGCLYMSSSFWLAFLPLLNVPSNTSCQHFGRSWLKQNDGGQKKKREVNRLHIPFKQTQTWSASLIRSFWLNSLSSPIQTDRSSNLNMRLLMRYTYISLLRTMLISEPNLWSPDREENHFPNVN